MVRKLLKYDFKAVLRIIVPINALLIIMAVFAKTTYTNLDQDYYNELIGAIALGYYSAVIAVIIVTLIIVLKRFYDNFYGQEGYLSFTLPVSVNQHLISKVITAVASSLITILTIHISNAIVDYEYSILHDFVISIELLVKEGQYEDFIHCIGNGLFLIAFVLSSYLVFFACIALGQRAKRNRRLVSSAIFICYFIVTVTLKSLVFIYDNPLIYYDLTAILQFIMLEPYYHIIFAILFKLLMAVIYYLIIHNSLNKHLNLE